jgi:hypothetical protein
MDFENSGLCMCGDCAEKLGGRRPVVAAWHVGNCSVCEGRLPVTYPAAFGLTGRHILNLKQPVGVKHGRSSGRG